MITEKIKAVLCDVDGVLTDNRLIFSDEAEPQKFFHVLDGHGTVLLRKHGVHCAWITGRKDVAMQNRANALGIDWYHAQAKNPKGKIVSTLLQQQNINPGSVVFVGDDVTDISAFEQVGWPVATANALPIVKKSARRVTRSSGGEGAFREVVQWVLHANSIRN